MNKSNDNDNDHMISLSQDGFESDCPETNFQTITSKSNCSEVHRGTLDSYFQSND